MAEYKCICCGEIRESEKNCTCPNCGYKMYPTPYNRKQVLADEINGFIQHIMLPEIKPEEISFFRQEPASKKSDSSDEKSKMITIPKSKDDKRFPDFCTIQGYVCASKKAEEFFAKLDKSLEEIKGHIHESYQQDYTAEYGDVKEKIDRLDQVLKEALRGLGITRELPAVTFPKLVLDYRETPNESLIDAADKLIDMLVGLSAKIKKFIKVNNIYGTAYQEKIKPSLKQSKEKNYAADLAGLSTVVAKVLKKHYEVDIFSDGSEELGEMLKVLWTAIYSIMTLPVLEKQGYYRFENGEVVIGDDFTKKVVELISSRYASIPMPVVNTSYIETKSEDAMFELYNAMIKLDSFGFMGINAAGLTNIGECEKELNRLIGLSNIKESIKKIKAYALANKGSDKLNIHMCFYGNPGTGKTEVARIIAGILYEAKILPTKKVVEVDRGGLVGQYVGETPQKTMRTIERAMGGVLFIDEAYALIPKDGGAWDYGQEAVATLIKAMEDYSGKFCVILAGYKNQMMEMLSSNPGFVSRIQFELDFPNYDRGELEQITRFMLQKRKYSITDDAMQKILDVTDIKRKGSNFANAREIRNILDQVIMCQSVRAAGTDDRELGIVDVNRYIQDSKINLPTTGNGKAKKILTGEEELDQLVGLASVKRMIKKIKAYAKKNVGNGSLNLHMCFYGNPGTGKTEVARILSRILHDAGVLAESKLVETDSTGLLGKVIGETGPKTRGKVHDAMGGVLFIDEAYQLTGESTSAGSATNYGDEAVAVLLKEMEDHHGQFCVILAGYKEEMKSMLSANPGFESRIQFSLDFPDYSREELGEIAASFLSQKKYEIEDSALERLLDVTEYYRNRPNFANARTVRNILDQVIMNQNLRAEDDPEDYTVIKDDVEDYILDEGLDMSNIANNKGKIGFGV